jgi:hypothetical protein
MFSVNNRLILEKYTKEGLRKDDSKTGFAMIAQKTRLKGLRLLVDAKIVDGTKDGYVIGKGSIIYIKEETLHTAPWAAKFLECDKIGEPFMIVDSAHIEFVADE